MAQLRCKQGGGNQLALHAIQMQACRKAGVSSAAASSCSAHLVHRRQPVPAWFDGTGDTGSARLLPPALPHPPLLPVLWAPPLLLRRPLDLWAPSVCPSASVGAGAQLLLHWAQPGKCVAPLAVPQPAAGEVAAGAPALQRLAAHQTCPSGRAPVLGQPAAAAALIEEALPPVALPPLPLLLVPAPPRVAAPQAGSAHAAPASCGTASAPCRSRGGTATPPLSLGAGASRQMRRGQGCWSCTPGSAAAGLPSAAQPVLHWAAARCLSPAGGPPAAACCRREG